MVLPNAISFLQNFNDDDYDILIQARDYYRFAVTVLIAMGVAVPGAGRRSSRSRAWGSSRPRQLRHTRRYAFLVSRCWRCCCRARIR